MSRVFVLGYPNNNLGDDLFFKILLERYPNSTFIFNHATDSSTLAHYDNVDKINIGGFKKIKLLFEIDMYVLIGGSMFQEVVPKRIWLRGVIHLIVEMIILKALRKRTAFIGFNFGPYTSKLYLNLNKILFRFVDYLSVRDRETFSLLKKNKNVHYSPDIVFGLDDSKYSFKKRDNSIAVSVMDLGPNVKFQNEYEDFLEKILSSLKSDINIKLFGFQHANDIDDLAVAKRLKEKLGSKNISIFQYNGNNLDEFLGNYYDNTYSISSRFHSFVLSLKAKQEIISIDYNIKVNNLRDTYNLKNTSIKPNEFKNIEKQDEIISEINSWFNSGTNCKNLYMNIEQVKQESERNFYFLDKYLR